MFNSQKSIDFLNTATVSHLDNLKRQAAKTKKLHNTTMVFELNHTANECGFTNWSLLVKAFNHKHSTLTKTITYYDTLYNEELFAHVGKQRSGLVLIGGGSGTGKTTLIKKMTAYLVNHSSKKIVSICHPWDELFVEKVSSSCKGTLTSLSVEGSNVEYMIKSLHSAQRMDSDAIILSELVYPELIAEVCDVAEAGFLVIAGVPMHNMYNMSIYDHPDPCLAQLKRWAPAVHGLDNAVAASVSIGVTNSKRIYSCKLYNK